MGMQQGVRFDERGEPYAVWRLGEGPWCRSPKEARLAAAELPVEGDEVALAQLFDLLARYPSEARGQLTRMARAARETARA